MGKFHFKVLSLKQILKATILSCVIVTTICSDILFINLFKKNIIEKNSKNRIDLLANIANSTSSIVNSTQSLSNMFYLNPDFLSIDFNDSEKDKNISQFLSSANQLINNYNQITKINYDYALILNDGSRYTYNSFDGFDSLENYQNQYWYKELIKIQSSSLWVSNYLVNGHYDDYIATSIDDKNGNNTGIFLFSISENEIYKTYANMIDKNIIYIINSEGKIISHNNTTMLGKTIPDFEEFKKSFGIKNYKIIDREGIKYACYNYLDTTKNWMYIEETPLYNILYGLNKIIAIIFIFSMILIIFFVFIISKVTELTVDPLSKLLLQLKKVASTEDNDLVFDINGWKEIYSLCTECNRMNKRIKQLVVTVKDTEKEKNTIEMNYLQAQIQPHFIYNTLFSIKCLIDLNQNKEASTATQNFILILKYSLSYKTQVIYLIDNIKFIDDYISLQNIRYGNCISLTIDCDISLYRYKILKFIMQPLIENSIVHGFTKDSDKINIELTIKKHDNFLYITIVDDGVGFPLNRNINIDSTTEKIASTNIGIDNIKNRIYKYYHTSESVKIDYMYKNGAKIDIKIPVIPDN